MLIDNPLRHLEIVIPEAALIAANRDLDSVQGVLVANKQKLLMRTTYRELLKERESILVARNMRIPEDWDLEWNFKLGPIWTPAELDGGVFWILPEYFQLEPDGSCTTDGNVSTASDRYSNYDFTQTVCDDMPTPGSALNGFKGLTLTDNEYLTNADTETGESTSGMLVGCMINMGTDESGYVFASDEPGTGEVTFRKSTASSATDMIFELNNVSATDSNGWVLNTNAMFTMGREAGGNAMSLSKDGGTADTATASGTTGDRPTFIGARTGPTAEMNGVVYEIVFALTGYTTALAQKIEGYFAHKYGVTGTLPAAHPYKLDPPRAATESSTTKGT